MRKVIVALLVTVITVCGIPCSAFCARTSNSSILEEELRVGHSPMEIVEVEVSLKDLNHDEVYSQFQLLYPEEYDYYMAIEEKEEPYENMGLNYSTSENNKVDENETRGEDILQRAIEHKREIYRSFYESHNSSIITDYKISTDDIIFQSSYAPFIIVRTDYDTVIDMSNDNRIEHIASFHNCTANEEDLNLANQITRANYVRDTCGLKGSGVKIGMVEALGIPNLNDSYLTSASIQTKPGDTNVRYHATMVARILVGTDSSGANDGLAPLAKLYCCIGGDSLSFYSGVEWLVNSGVNVINASMGLDYTGTYDSLSRWVDHLAVNHDVHFVKSAGNYDEEVNPYYHISSPGMAYNAITVGGLSPNDSTNVTYFSIYSDTCDVEIGTERAEKPNLIAPATYFWDYEGTSFSAPQVAGTIAQLCGYNTDLKKKQSTMGAILMAAAAHKVNAVGNGKVGDNFTSGDRIDNVTQISDIEGAGVLDSRWARDIVANGKFWWPTVYDAGFPYSKTVTITANETSVVRICIFWLRQNSVSSHTSGNVTTGTMSDLKLQILNPSGSIAAESNVSQGNFEIVQFTPHMTGNYTIKIIDLGGHSGKDYIGIAMWNGTLGN